MGAFSTLFLTQSHAAAACAVTTIITQLNTVVACFAIAVICKMKQHSNSHYVILLTYFIADLLHVCAYSFSVISSCYVAGIQSEILCKVADYVLFNTTMLVLVTSVMATLGALRIFSSTFPIRVLFPCADHNCIFSGSCVVVVDLHLFE